MNVLLGKKIWFADWTTFNDPGEGQYVMDNRGLSEVHRITIDFDRVESRFYNTKTALSVLCCSDRFNNSLLWSLYADSHRGICIGFDVIQEESHDYRPIKVAYRDAIPALKIKQLNHESAIKVLSIKGKDYSTEEEVRYIRKKQQGLNKIRVQEVTLGLHYTSDIYQSVRNSKGRGVPLYKCRRSELDTYKLDRELV